MLEEDFCSYEVAKLLKEKGFDEPCIRHWDCDDHSLYGYNDIPISNSELQANEYNGFSAPTHQMAMKWLREVHKVVIVIDAYHADHWEGYIDSFEISIYSHASTIIVPNEIAHHTDYTEAVEVVLKFCLENLI